MSAEEKTGLAYLAYHLCDRCGADLQAYDSRRTTLPTPTFICSAVASAAFDRLALHEGVGLGSIDPRPRCALPFACPACSRAFAASSKYGFRRTAIIARCEVVR